MSSEGGADDPAVVKIVVIITIGVILWTAVVCIALVAIFTDRSVLRAELLTFAGVLLLGAFGGVSWAQLRRRHWHIEVERNGNGGSKQ